MTTGSGGPPAGNPAVDRVAARTGFVTPDSLRRHLLQRVGMTPRASRAHFARPVRSGPNRSAPGRG